MASEANTIEAASPAARANQGVVRGERIRAREPLYLELVEFLDDEAELLDENRLSEWIDLLAEDIRYWAPVRVTRRRRDGSEFAERIGHFDDDLAMLKMRVDKLDLTTTAWAEDPPSRTRRFVTNVKAFRSEVEGEFVVLSNLLLVRNRWDLPTWELLSARREDLVRREPGGWKLARRTIWIDQSTLALANLAVFL